MHDIKMTSSDGIILNTSGKYCEDNIKVVPTFDFIQNSKRWIVEISVEQTTSYDVITEDQWLSEHYNDQNLRITMLPLEYTIPSARRVLGFCAGNKNYDLSDSGFHGSSFRIDASGVVSMLAMYDSIFSNSSNDRPRLYGSGTLQIKSGLCAGKYQITAWLE